MKNTPTVAQAEAMLLAQKDGTNTLNRGKTNLWRSPHASRISDWNGTPTETATTATVLALIRKGLVTVTKTSKNRLGEYPVQVTLTPLP